MERTCRYQKFFPHDNNKMHCFAYCKSKRKDGLYWAHYPYCEDKNCPLAHPELLEGAKLK